MTRTAPTEDYDWVVVGSGFGGSVAALRLAEKGYRVALVERGRRYADDELPQSAGDRRRFVWAPSVGLRGIMHNRLFGHVFSSSQTGVGGGSLVYGGVLFRAHEKFFVDPQWRDLAEWDAVLSPHYGEAERLLGVRPVPWLSAAAGLTREVAQRFGRVDDFSPAPIAVFLGQPGLKVPDPYFGGEGPPRTGCTRCGECMTGCRVGAANRLTTNYLWFAEKHGAVVLPEREVVDIRPSGAADGSDGYLVSTVATSRRRLGAGRRTELRAGGVVVAGGAIGTNELLAGCKHRGSLPRISDRLGTLVRTNSETVLSVLLPDDETWRDAHRDVAASSRVVLDGDTQIELLTYGPGGDFMRFLFTTLVGDGSTSQRRWAWARSVARDPGAWLETLRRGWGRRTLMMLVMQPRDNALRFRAVRRKLSPGFRLVSERDPARPAPTYLARGHEVARWLAQRTGGIAQSSIFEALGNRPMTAHVLGGAPIGADADSGVVDRDLRVFGYANLLVCDAAALPANPGVNPALTITALAEHAMATVPASTGRDRGRVSA